MLFAVTGYIFLSCIGGYKVEYTKRREGKTEKRSGIYDG